MGLFTVGLRDDDFEPAYKFPALPHRVRGRCLFPSQAAYEDPAFPEEQLRMLASKTSIKLTVSARSPTKPTGSGTNTCSP